MFINILNIKRWKKLRTKPVCFLVDMSTLQYIN